MEVNISAIMNETSTMVEYELTTVDINIVCPGYSITPSNHCPVFYDQILCWPPTPRGNTAELMCPNVIHPDLKVYRHCPVNASWENLKSDYSACLGALPDSKDVRLAEAMRDIYFILSITSLVLLLVTLFIFQYFKSLQCSRISIHKHLVVSFIFRFIFNIIITEPLISNTGYSYRNIDWLCKVILALSQYTTLANVFWMFVEGFFLHHSLVLGVFSTKAPFKLFYSIGWGLPVVFTAVWAIVLHFQYNKKCWDDYSTLNYYYIIVVPFILALVVNLVFLVNIIRVLVSKLRANNRIESANIRKAIKATVVLMPLLGITNLLFVMAPDNKQFKVAYHVTNAVLHSSQGIFVAILYCFLNGEVRRVLKQKWYRFRIRHGRHPSGRRRTSRTSSFFLTSGTEDDHRDQTTHQNAASEQLRLMQANLDLKKDDFDARIKPEEETNHVINNGSNGDVNMANSWKKKNNNNGEVHFNLEPIEYILDSIERETVI